MFLVVLLFLGVLLTWIVETAVYYLLSLVFGGTGGFRRLLAAVAWASVPAFAWSIIIAFPSYLYLYYFRGVAVEALVETPPLLVQVTTYLGILPSLWAVYIIVLGLRHYRNLTLRQAIIVGAIPQIAVYAILYFRYGQLY